MNQRFAHATAFACLVMFIGLTLGVPVPDYSPSWAELEEQKWTQRLLHAEEGSWIVEKASRKLANIEAMRAGQPPQGHPDEFMRYLEQAKIPSDRNAPEYDPGYQLRELQQARAARASRGVPLPWVNRGPGNVAGRARAIVVDPSDPSGDTWLIASVGGGVWKTTDQGATWTGLMDDLPMIQMQSLAVSPADPLTIYAGTGESFWNIDTLNGNGMFKSTDGGVSWTQLSSTIDDYRFNNVSRIIVSPTDQDLVLCSTTVGTTKVSLQPTSHIFRSTDGGSTWTEVHQETGTDTFSGPRILQLLADPDDFSVQYATVYGAGIMKSTDTGQTWSYINTGITDFTGRFEMAISPINTDYLYASAMGTAGNSSVSRLWHSIDGGASWVGGTETSTSNSWLGAQGWYDNTIICSPVDPKIVYVGGIRLWKLQIFTLGSTGYGSSQLSTGSVHVDNHGLHIVEPAGGGWYILNTNDGGVGFSSSGETGWTAPIAGLTTTQFYGVDKRPGRSAYVGGMQDNGTWRSPVNSARTDNWTFQIGGDGYETSWHFDDPQKIIGGYQFNGFARSLDGGNSWEDARNGLADTGGGNAPFLTKIGKSNARPDHLFAVGKSGPWRSTDFGGNWSLQTLNGGTWGSLSSFHDIRVSEADPDVVWAGARMDANNDIFVSTNGGVTYDPVNQFPDVTMGRITGMATHPTEPGTAFLLFSFAQRSKLLRTTDYGVTWTDISGFGTGTVSTNGFPDVAIYDLVVFPNDPNTIWVGSEIGLIESTDGGATWALADNGFPSVGIWYLVIEEDEVVVASHGRGIWSVQIPELAAGQVWKPLFETMVQPPSGILELTATLRSAADSTHVILDGGVLTTFGPNASLEEVVVQVPVLANGTRTARFRSFIGDVPYDSLEKSVDVFVVADPLANYANDMTDDSEIQIIGGFSIQTPSGFSSPALHTTHDYPDGQTLMAMMLQPIHIGDQTTLSFDEVVIVEPGDPGTVFGDYAFWDYVTVEGSLDGVNWVNVVEPYDSRADSAWLGAYNTGQSGNSSYYRNRQILLNDTFGVGDKIFLRFKLWADGFVNSWGWAIDNLLVNTPATNAPESRRFALAQNSPNPFNPQTEIRFELPLRTQASLRVFDLRGRLVKTLIDGPREAGPQTIIWDGRDARGARVASGVYLYQLRAGDQVEQRKMTLVK
jgi:hypothetical protein